MEKEPGLGTPELTKRFPEAGLPALHLLPALARFRLGKG
jgi:hypothetical protein